MTDKQLWDLCQKYGGKARKRKRKFAALLPEVERRKLWEKHGFYSIYHFAAKIGGVGKSTVDEILRTFRKVEDKPLLKAEIEKQGWGKVRAVASLPLEEEDLVEMVQTLPKATLEEYAKNVKQQDCQTPPGWDPEPDRTLRIDKFTEFRLKNYRQRLEKQQKRAITLKETLNILLDQVEESPRQRPQRLSREGKRYVSAGDRRKVEEKYGGKCAMCDDPYTEIHHPDRFAKTGSHKRLVPLCHDCHQLAHAGLIENEYDPPHKWRVREKMLPNEIDKKYLEHLY